MTNREAIIYLTAELEHTRKAIPAAQDARAHRVLEESAEAFRMAIDALQCHEEKDPQQPLTMAELRQMHGETVYCLDLNTEVKISAPNVGFIKISYSFPGEWGSCKANGLTLYRTRPKEETP